MGNRAPETRDDDRSRMKRRPAACVMGDIDLVHALAHGGIPSVAAASPDSPARFSRFTRETLSWVDPWDQPEPATEALLRYGRSQPEPPVLFYQDDASLLLVSRQRERLRRAFRFVVPDATLVEDLVDKARFQALAARLALPVPPARILAPAHEAPPDDLAYPVLVKPLTRRPRSWDPVAGGAKAIRYGTPAALRDAWPRLASAGLTLLAQSEVVGPETRIESFHVYQDAEGTVAGFTGRKIRTYPAAFGDSTALEITDQPDVAEAGADVVRRLGLVGVAKLDFKRDARGRLHLLEVNPRFTLWHHPGALAGVNIPRLVYGDLTGEPRPPALRVRVGVRWCRLWADWPAARAAGIPFLRWLPWALASEAKKAMVWHDPMPLVGAALWRLAPRASQGFAVARLATGRTGARC
jgi:predicted ATP-grasp superfamily ATP-dependent carboligase